MLDLEFYITSIWVFVVISFQKIYTYLEYLIIISGIIIIFMLISAKTLRWIRRKIRDKVILKVKHFMQNPNPCFTSLERP